MSDPRRHDANGHDALDRRFAERLAERYRPEPFGPVQRARFDATLRERIGERRRAPGLVPALVGAAAVLALAWWSWPAATPTPAPEGVRVARATTAATEDADAAGWEAEVMLVGADDTLTEEEYLPDEYLVIASAFIDDV